MPSEIKSTIHAQEIEISVISKASKEDYISLTDIAKYHNPELPGYVIQNWMRNRSTIEYLGLWEHLNNAQFNYIEFEAIKLAAGNNSFAMTPKKWIRDTNAVGIISKQGRYAATFAHKDIAFEFASWISPEFKLYIIKDYQRLKEDETHQYALDWDVKRIISKANYRIHTDAIKRKLIPASVSKQQQGYVYATEADLLNVALFGMTAAQWREKNPDARGNIRDQASIEQLLVLSNMENANALLIEQGLSQRERLVSLNKLAISQLALITGTKSIKELTALHEQSALPEK